MNIFEFVENISLDKQNLTNELRKEIIKAYSLDHWIRLTKTFLKGLDKYHSVPGKDIQRLYDYLNHHAERNQLTWEQQWHLMAIIVENWHQMSCESRADLLL